MKNIVKIIKFYIKRQKNSLYIKANNKCYCEKGFLFNNKTNQCKKNICGLLCLSWDDKYSVNV